MDAVPWDLKVVNYPVDSSTKVRVKNVSSTNLKKKKCSPEASNPAENSIT